MWLPRQRHVFKTPLPRHLPHNHHSICHIIVTSSSTSSLQVTWRVNPWRSLSSQILGFGLGSMGFTPIYDALRMSWITLIYDENLRTSREGIRDAQYMTFSNFVIDEIDHHRLRDIFVVGVLCLDFGEHTWVTEPYRIRHITRAVSRNFRTACEM
jgi:hypothetical protein